MKSFRIKLLIYFFVLVLVALVLPSWHFGAKVNEDIMQETQNRATQDLELVAWLLRDHPGFLENGELDAWITELGEKMAVRITFIQDGVVVADSQVPYEQVPGMDFHGNRPEVVQARSEDLGMQIRYSHTLEKDLVYVAMEVDYLPGVGGGVLRLATPFSIVKARLDSLRDNMALGLMLTLGAVVLLAVLISRNLAQSIRRLARTAQAIGRGDYGKRIRFYPGSEFKPLAQAINSMASGIEQHISTIEEQRGQILAVLNGMAEGVMTLDSRGRITHFNPSLERMFPELVSKVGKRPLEVIMEPAIQQAADSILSRDEAESMTVPITLNDGRCIEVNLEPYYTDDGQRQLVLVFHDMTVTRQAEQMQKDFVANVSHELRTPLTSIKGYAETLMAGQELDKAMADKFLSVILKNADHMSSMVNDLLRLARQSHAAEDREMEAVDLVEVVDGVIRDLAPSAGLREVVLENRLQGDVLVLANTVQLTEVVRNLMENAIHYGPDKGVVWADGTVRDTLFECSVHDQGSGVPEKERKRVFERFFRGATRADHSSKDGHAGLGLAICKQLVTSMGGEVWTETDTRGSVFRFTLPLA